jgi:hypothetical protein
MVMTLCKVHSIFEGTICMGCDGEIALNHVFGEGAGYDADVGAADYDMISAIWMAMVQWTYCHVKGHQDDDRNKLLDWWAHLNVEMDNLAKAFWADQVETAVVWNIVFPDE